MNRYERRLPHYHVIGQPLFVTFRLFGSLPANRVFPPKRLTNGRAFVTMDRLLDNARTGPLWLKQPEIEEMIVRAIQDGENRFERYELHAFAVMANHVHLLVTPRVMGPKWLGPLKGFTAHEAIRMLGLHGSFWQDETYDDLVRDGGFERIKRYIENNPVKAGLVTEPDQFPWSSAVPGRSPAAGPGSPARPLLTRWGGGREAWPHCPSTDSSN